MESVNSQHSRGDWLTRHGVSKWAWFHSYGYNSDPLCIKPNKSNIARERETADLLSHLSSGNITVIYGANGIGKTALLMQVQEQGKDIEGIRLHCLNMVDGFEQIKEIVPKIASENPRSPKISLLLDECDYISRTEMEYLRQLYDTNKVYAMVLAFPDQRNANISTAMRQRIAFHLQLRKLNTVELIQMLEERLKKDTKMLDPEALQQLAVHCNGNPRKFLLSCQRMIMKQHFGLDNEEENGINQVLQEVMQQYSQKGEGEEKNWDCTFDNLTPLQRVVMETLAKQSCSLDELSDRVGSSKGTIGKQISLLSLNANKAYMKNKGINQALVEKRWNNRRMVYSLSAFGKQLTGN